MVSHARTLSSTTGSSVRRPAALLLLVIVAAGLLVLGVGFVLVARAPRAASSTWRGRFVLERAIVMGSSAATRDDGTESADVTAVAAVFVLRDRVAAVTDTRPDAFGATTVLSGQSTSFLHLDGDGDNMNPSMDLDMTTLRDFVRSHTEGAALKDRVPRVVDFIIAAPWRRSTAAALESPVFRRWRSACDARSLDQESNTRAWHTLPCPAPRAVLVNSTEPKIVPHSSTNPHTGPTQRAGYNEVVNAAVSSVSSAKTGATHVAILSSDYRPQSGGPPMIPTLAAEWVAAQGILDEVPTDPRDPYERRYVAAVQCALRHSAADRDAQFRDERSSAAAFAAAQQRSPAGGPQEHGPLSLLERLTHRHVSRQNQQGRQPPLQQHPGPTSLRPVPRGPFGPRDTRYSAGAVHPTTTPLIDVGYDFLLGAGAGPEARATATSGADGFMGSGKAPALFAARRFSGFPAPTAPAAAQHAGVLRTARVDAVGAQCLFADVSLFIDAGGLDVDSVPSLRDLHSIGRGISGNAVAAAELCLAVLSLSKAQREPPLDAAGPKYRNELKAAFGTSVRAIALLYRIARIEVNPAAPFPEQQCAGKGGGDLSSPLRAEAAVMESAKRYGAVRRLSMLRHRVEAAIDKMASAAAGAVRVVPDDAAAWALSIRLQRDSDGAVFSTGRCSAELALPLSNPARAFLMAGGLPDPPGVSYALPSSWAASGMLHPATSILYRKLNGIVQQQADALVAEAALIGTPSNPSSSEKLRAQQRHTQCPRKPVTGLPSVLPPLHVVWSSACCGCCGFSAEITHLALPLQRLHYVSMMLGQECFCGGYPDSMRSGIARAFLSTAAYARPWSRPATPMAAVGGAAAATSSRASVAENPAKNGEADAAAPIVVWVSHTDPSLYRHRALERRAPDYFVGRTMYEFTVLPAEWASLIDRPDVLWVPSTFVRDVFAENGVPRHRMRIVPEAVDTDFLDPAVHAPMPLPLGSWRHDPGPSGGPTETGPPSGGKKKEPKFFCNYDHTRDYGQPWWTRSSPHGDDFASDKKNESHRSTRPRPFTIFSHFKWEPRKGWDALFSAYERAFGTSAESAALHKCQEQNCTAAPERNVREHHSTSQRDARGRRAKGDRETRLYILTYLFLSKRTEGYSIFNTTHIVDELRGFVRVAFPSLVQMHEDPLLGLPPFCLIVESVSEEALARLHAAADVFVLPTRGEGWGLPAIQAMAMGRPVVSTRYGGQLDFMTEDTSFLIDVERVEELPPDSVYGYVPGKRWALPSVSHTTALMRRLYDDPVLGEKVGAAARADIVRRFSEPAVASVLDAELQRIRLVVLNQRRGVPSMRGPPFALLRNATRRASP